MLYKNKLITKTWIKGNGLLYVRYVNVSQDVVLAVLEGWEVLGS
jgi:hypothetical protein